MIAVGAISDLIHDGGAQDQSAQDHPAMVNGRPVPAVHGVWRSRRYGYVVRIGQDGLKLFHVAGGFCYADPRPERDPDDLFRVLSAHGA
jgi:carboxyl-terminal processing protease